MELDKSSREADQLNTILLGRGSSSRAIVPRNRRQASGDEVECCST